MTDEQRMKLLLPPSSACPSTAAPGSAFVPGAAVEGHAGAAPPGDGAVRSTAPSPASKTSIGGGGRGGGSPKSTIIPRSIAAMTDEQRAKLRAERFGVPNEDVEKAKKMARAERFGTSNDDLEKEKKKQRAERFGLDNKDLETDKKKQRQERFGTGTDWTSLCEVRQVVDFMCEGASTIKRRV